MCFHRFYSSPYSISTNRMIAQTSITPFIAASPVPTYQVSLTSQKFDECRGLLKTRKCNSWMYRWSLSYLTKDMNPKWSYQLCRIKAILCLAMIKMQAYVAELLLSISHSWAQMLLLTLSSHVSHPFSSTHKPYQVMSELAGSCCTQKQDGALELYKKPKFKDSWLKPSCFIGKEKTLPFIALTHHWQT